MSWLTPVFDVGSPVIDFRIWYDDSTNGETFTIFVSGVVDQTYTATGLMQGSVYQFKVESRNMYGYSALFSNIVSILAA